MTERYYYVSLGGDMSNNVIEAASTGSTAIESRITFDATGMNKMEAIKGLRAIIDYLEQGSALFPPA